MGGRRDGLVNVTGVSRTSPRNGLRADRRALDGGGLHVACGGEVPVDDPRQRHPRHLRRRARAAPPAVLGGARLRIGTVNRVQKGTDGVGTRS